jgi:hypothetical protein
MFAQNVKSKHTRQQQTPELVFHVSTPKSITLGYNAPKKTPAKERYDNKN